MFDLCARIIFKHLRWFSLGALLLGGGCATAPHSNPYASSMTPAAATASIPRNAGERAKLHVLPASFSDASQRNYAPYIEKLQAQGFGNAVWSELEDVLYESNYFELVMESPTNVQAIRDILSATGAAPKIALPEKVMTINTNFFVNTTESMSMMNTSKTQQYHATVYLRYYELDGAAINAAVPATGDGVAGDLLTATRMATRNAAIKLLKRISRQ